ncbi:hypothetical protein ABIF07_001053 [Bradyrhizobium elkanii]|uniref:hypothetical protein n=1 Tax=Bradyrhizobium elkanii TaxID=29448 RepID=UPI0021670868|nr:hypothetical protein [Bradyrhizobium elkanii]MCS3692031.1 hypothetical protein [Bradyrhizobium elkanii]
MDDEELLVQAANAPTIYCDGFGAFRQINGALRCVGYVIGSGAQVNLIISIAGAEAANAEAKRVLEEKPVKPSAKEGRLRLAH